MCKCIRTMHERAQHLRRGQTVLSLLAWQPFPAGLKESCHEPWTRALSFCYHPILCAVSLSQCPSPLAWLRSPKYFHSIWISRQYYFWGCGMLVGFLRPNFVRPISDHREWLRTMMLKSALFDGHLHARCLVCLQPAHNVIPGQTLAIGYYGRSRVALGRSNRFKL